MFTRGLGAGRVGVVRLVDLGSFPRRNTELFTLGDKV